MINASIPNNEVSRLQALHSLNILDTPLDARYDSITKFAAGLLEVPICLITFIDTDRQWFKSTYGLDGKECPRDISFCAHAIYEINSNNPTERIFEILDTTADKRFIDNPFVIDQPNIRSYISYVLQSDSGENIGTICAVDTVSRKFAESKRNLLILLGSMIENLLYGKHHLADIERKFI